MIKVDLITGFLGAGKTTFIKKYVEYLVSKNEKICILENDYGAINVDMMYLSDMVSDKVHLEMVAGGCDYDCHKRRFKTKMITMAMLGYDRVIIEPSGIFDVDEFYDILHEDSLYKRYEISNVLSIVNSDLEPLSLEATYMLASQIATAGRIIFSHVQEVDEKTIQNTMETLYKSLDTIYCKRTFDKVTCKDWDALTEDDFDEISNSGYMECAYVKKFSMDENAFQSLFFMNLKDDKETLVKNIEKLWKDPSIGNIIRIKGFVYENGWYEINSTSKAIHIKPILNGQTILIVIGENLDANRIDSYFKSEYSSTRTG
ncbi:MAG: GTPase (G3E family) [Holdemanella sp.]|nr:GTPase (G3E family) [Holdemanella sp.]